MEQVQFKSKSLDHLGLVAGFCQEIQLGKMIDNLLPAPSDCKKVSYGTLVESMILNGLGFTGRTLHMYPDYFSDKPIERLHSQHARARELAMLDKRVEKSSHQSAQSLKKLLRQAFSCPSDAKSALEHWEKQQKYVVLEHSDIVQKTKHRSRGRPSADAQGDTYYQVSALIKTCPIKKQKATNMLGLFILATNDTSKKLTMESLLAHYKSQQAVERGFRFLKSPDFLVSSLYLKKP